LTLLLSVLLLLSILLREWIHGRLSSALLLLLVLLLLLLLLHHVVLSFLGPTHLLLLLLLLRAFVGASRLSEVGLRQMTLSQLARSEQMRRVVALILIAVLGVIHDFCFVV